MVSTHMVTVFIAAVSVLGVDVTIMDAPEADQT